MTTNSCTKRIKSDTFVTVASATDITLTSGKVYTMQIQDEAWLKLADAVFYFNNEKFQFKQGADDLYIKSGAIGCVLTILEQADEDNAD